jgi:pimeloyl-ACP methyl ester carboxylesterase
MAKNRLKKFLRLPGCIAILLVFVIGCTEIDEIEIGGAGQGEACHQVSDCNAGFTCENGVCVPVPPISTGPQRGDPCTGHSDCGSNLYCGTQGVCTVTAGSELGAPCGLSIDCIGNLVCHGDTLRCVDPSGAGTKDLGQTCLGFTDCRRPYLCSIANALNAKCEKLPFFPGPDCTRTETEAGAFRVYYEIPPETIPLNEPFEFYRLPFPNDIRISGGNISLRGHPSPGEVMGIDVAGEYIRAIEQDADGYALNGPVFFRLTDFPELSSICLEAGSLYPEEDRNEYCQGGTVATIMLVNTNDYNQPIPVQIGLYKDRSQYICQNALGVGPLDGQPLEPNTTYLAVLTTGLRDVRNDPPIQDRDFVRIVEGDQTLPAGVIQATEPLRTWISAESIDPTTIAAAAVFTTGDPGRIGEDLYNAVYDIEPAPTFNNDAFSCDNPPGPPVPVCHGRLVGGGSIASRDCGSSAAFTEIHGTYQAPVFQKGTRPYLTSDFGGDMNFNSVSGLPEEDHFETICYALTIPDGVSMPVDGWPVIIYSHGTGGNYRSFIEKPITADLAALGFAVIGIDNVMHGPRQDPSADSISWVADLWNMDQPGNLYFNVINARAARDNTLQGGVDLLYLTRLVANDSPVVGGVDTEFDPDQIYFIGHSQGTTIMSPYLEHETELRAAVLSGAGAELVLSILNKTKPVNIAELAGTLFGDKNLTRIHPMMGLLAILFGPADSIAYASKFVVNPPRQARPLLMFSGIGDSFTPYPTQAALIRAMDIPLVRPVELAIDGVEDVASPVSDVTINGSAAGVPAAVLQYTPSAGNDGHFVMFDISQATTALGNFLTSVLNDNPRITR